VVGEHRADGNKYEGFWRGGHRDGYGVRTWPDGDVFEGDWVAGKRTGKGTYSWPNGTTEFPVCVCVCVVCVWLNEMCGG